MKSPAGNYYHCWIESWMTIIRWLTKKEKITQSKQTNKQTNVLSQFRSSISDENEIVVLSFNWWGIKEFNHPVQKVKQTLILALFIWRILPWVKGSPPPPPPSSFSWVILSGRLYEENVDTFAWPDSARACRWLQTALKHALIVSLRPSWPGSRATSCMFLWR